MAGKENKKIVAVDIQRATVVTGLAGGSSDVEAGEVLLVGKDISEADAGFLCACGKGKACDPKLKAVRAKEKAAAEKVAAEKVAAEKVAAEKVAAEKATAEKATAENK